MTETVIFFAVFGGFFVLRIVAATVFFYYILPEGDRCPHCDAPTIRVESRGWNRICPWLRTSWCYECHWEGMLRHGPLTPAPTPDPHTAPPAAPARKSRTP